jgi:electron transfer flavoprotein alpha subunit
MGILVFIDATNGKILKSGFETIFLGSKLAQQSNGNLNVLVLGNPSNIEETVKYTSGVVTVAENVNTSDNQVLSRVVADFSQKSGAKIVLTAHDNSGKAVAPRVAARLNAGIVTGITNITGSDLKTANKAVFSGKAFADIKITTEICVYTLSQNTFQPELSESTGSINKIRIEESLLKSRITIKETQVKEGEISLPEAEIIVSAGRGMKGPENWGMIEDLAAKLGAATACSRPVADIGWRPHHEHVGQTGVTVAPNLYFAIGISGAIQHLAGVNRSKTIVVINKDPEAPFFKAADYGIIGDAFDVVPKLISAVEKFNASKN